MEQSRKSRLGTAGFYSTHGKMWMLLMGGISSLLLLHCSKPSYDREKIFARFAEHFDSGFGARKAEDPCHEIMQGVSLYNARSYAEAIPELQQLLPQTTNIRKCGGVGQMGGSHGLLSGSEGGVVEGD